MPPTKRNPMKAWPTTAHAPRVMPHSDDNQAEPNSKTTRVASRGIANGNQRATQGSPYKPATAKGADPSEANAQQGQGNHADAHEATDRDVKAAKNKLQDSAGEAQAKEQLERIAKEAKDPQVRKAAQEALDGADAARKRERSSRSKNRRAERWQSTRLRGWRQTKASQKATPMLAKTAGAGQDSARPQDRGENRRHHKRFRFQRPRRHGRRCQHQAEHQFPKTGAAISSLKHSASASRLTN